MNLTKIKTFTIPEGSVKSISINGNQIWKKPSSIYTELEYIESTGTQYIDTGIIGKSGIEIYMKYEYTVISGSSILFGATGNDKRIYTAHSKGYIGYGGTTITTKLTPEINTVYDTYTKLYPGEQVFVVNGDNIVTKTYSSEINNGLNCYMFAYNSGKASTLSNAKIYFCRVLMDGVLVRDFVPCRRNSDGKVCMYDRVTNTFFENLGTGEFLAGEY